MAHVITQPCCNDASCVSVCPVDCIHPTPDERTYARTEMLFIDPATCIDCGACVDECPVDAIVPEGDMTPEMQAFPDLNAAYYQDNPIQPRQIGLPGAERPTIRSASETLRVAIVGSGPSACYLADELTATKGLDVLVTVVEKLPVIGGLVRYGVAPDHGRTKNVVGTFARTLGRKNCIAYLNVEIGRHISHEELLAHHHAVVYASGAAGDRALGILGEALPGVHSAREFVAWYNGHPDFVGAEFDFSSSRAVVIGNGNVALDAARILVSDVSRLMKTDIADYALEALAASRIREVIVLGRRAADSAAFSTPELIGLGNLAGVDVTTSEIVHRKDAEDSLTRMRHAVLDGYGTTESGTGNRRIHLQFLRTPVEILGTERATGIRVERNVAALDGAGSTVEPTGFYETIESGLILRSIGFRGATVGNLPFDDVRGVLPNDAGAVVDPRTGQAVRGAYVAGWLKRGPTGVIGTNKLCSIETARRIVADFVGGRLATPGAGTAEFDDLVALRQPQRLDLKGWKNIDNHERNLGRSAGRPRVKIVSRDDMVDVAQGSKVRAGTREPERVAVT
ncbi:4Fe-4S binding protein [Rhodococcus aetherivorans]|uniref:4Fe-4S binding protein n=1 Tax=Rhodococcus aetherivorans TaxID=191292 RepID=UPI00241C7B01|nr:4Fe-4S binding protein [Rhodococcus aetherivorans]WFS15768.1 4Fe-4S binding protein [Rhodococcus aetherivorans]